MLRAFIPLVLGIASDLSGLTEFDFASVNSEVKSLLWQVHVKHGVNLESFICGYYRGKLHHFYLYIVPYFPCHLELFRLGTPEL